MRNSLTFVKKANKLYAEGLSSLKNSKNSKQENSLNFTKLSIQKKPKVKQIITSNLKNLKENIDSKLEKTNLEINNYIEREKQNILEELKESPRNLCDDSFASLNPSIQRTLIKKFNVFDSVDSSEEDDDKPKEIDLNHRSFYLPTDYSYRLITSAIDFFCLLSIIVFPYQLAAYGVVSNWLLPLAALTDIFMIFDIVLTIFTAETDIYGYIKTHKPEKLFFAYLRQWFVFDCASAVPISLVYNQTSASEGGLMAILIFRFAKFFKKNSTYNKLNLVTNAHLSQILKSLILFGIFIHLVSCFFSEFYFESQHVIASLGTGDIESRYSISVYFVLATSLSVGYGDIVPVTTEQRLFTITFMTVGIFFYSYFISAFSNYFTNSNPELQKIKGKIDMLYKISKEYDIPKKTFNSLKIFIKELDLKIRTDALRLVTNLPINLRKALLDKMFGMSMNNIKLFRNTSYTFVLAALNDIHYVRYFKNEKLVERGYLFMEIEIVLKGKLRLECDGVQIHRVNRFSSIGEAHVFGSEQVDFDLVCDSNRYEGFVMFKDSLLKLSTDFTDIIDKKLGGALLDKEIIEEKCKIAREMLLRGCSSEQIYEEVYEFSVEVKKERRSGKLDLKKINKLAGKRKRLQVDSKLIFVRPISKRHSRRKSVLETKFEMIKKKIDNEAIKKASNNLAKRTSNLLSVPEEEHFVKAEVKNGCVSVETNEHFRKDKVVINGCEYKLIKENSFMLENLVTRIEKIEGLLRLNQ